MDHFPNFWGPDIWPANACDINPLDFSVWSIVEQKIPPAKRYSLNTLKTAIQKAWDDIPDSTLADIVNNFKHRVASVVKARGGHIEIAR